MALTKEYIVALSKLNRVGKKTILKIGNYIADKGLEITTPDELVSK